MIRMRGPRQRFCGPSRKQRPDRTPLGANLGHSERGRSFARDDHQIDPVRQQLGERPEALTAEPLHPVSKDRAAHAPGNDQAQPRGPRRRGLRCDEKGKVRRAHAPARALRVNEFAVRAEPSLGPHRGPAGSLSVERPGYAIVQRVYFL
jgi:hypothetical protein